MRSEQMYGKSYTVDLRAPAVDKLRLGRVLRAIGNPVHRRILTRLLSDPADERGFKEHPLSTLGLRPGELRATRSLRSMRRAGLIHQRPGRAELLVRLRSHDLEARFPGLLEHFVPTVARTPPAGSDPQPAELGAVPRPRRGRRHH